MTDDEAVAMHMALATYHAEIVKKSILDIVKTYHADLAEALKLEAIQIPKRSAVHERLREHVEPQSNPLER